MVSPHKIFYKGEENDFVVFVEDREALDKFREDSSIPLVDVISVFQVFTNRQGGVEGQLLQASKTELENEFGTKNTDEVIKKIVLEGSDKSNASINNRKFNSHNDSMGPDAITN
ncbi:hypothetical protein PSN45_005268 [Yamadazyma tenuis]|uniref:Ribosome maturation protein SDO1/SBDS N-terminal domain-containing protein n=1 Tax=Candida tenuis (strain ATCC 10573 / BCRC 21748 / CBS 615 / JCM 9827 / NBRC 10315 / NRRL Y-1498 / VKM Y-70) TaxID=590646 RepID=G3B197_CANTC|nr:uncharacterized protein CANTEDRAFT_121094 [Yamadazyma tenuis ATCC 10573]EGV64915.1 hypothetical protein CANTEDRAFT_121094 [Yamadazyma tenuis ATCC 10573]WEJ97710.1 hypothetical protein PSN45_005268 [Yamadazyma tenuis]